MSLSNREFNDIEAERKLLRLSISGINFYNIRKKANKNDFFFEENKRLYSLFEYVDKSLYAVTYENVLRNLEKHEDLDQIALLNDIKKIKVDESDLSEVAQRVYYASALRNFINGFKAIYKNENIKTNIDFNVNMFSVTEEYVKKIKMNNMLNYEAKSHEECVEEVIRTIKDNKDSNSILLPGAIPTGFKSLDRIIGGFKPGDVSIIGADSHTGKTVFVSNMALYMAASSISVLFIALEGSILNLTQRTISSATQIPLSQLTRPGTFEEKNIVTINSYADVSKQFNLNIVVKSGISIYDIAAIVEKEKSINNTNIVFIDHIHAISRDGSKSENDTLTKTSMELHKIAEKGVAVVALSQLNRDIRNRIQPTNSSSEDPSENIPTLASIRGSDAITQFADNIIFLSRPKYSDSSMKPEIRVTVAKNRNDANKDSFMLYFKNLSTELSE